MNIKSVVGHIIPVEPQKRVEGANEVRTQASTDRDANGQRQQSQQEEKGPLTEEEFDQAVALLREHHAVKASQLTIRVASENDMRVIYIEDLDGKPIRRLTESELWTVTRSQDRPTGAIYDKAM